MIIQLQPEQVVKFWGAIKFGVVKVARVTGDNPEERMNCILKNLLSGKFQCWIVYEMEGGEKKLYAMAITYIQPDWLTEERAIFIDTLYGFRKLSNELAKDSIEKVRKYAKANNCTEIKAITESARVIELMTLTGFKSSQQIYSLEVV